ncbi:Zn-ribbon domain-containing OB-fold protein [Nocardia nova]|uniref:Zn-ribbon domain-containing OB-fold protein n=1 Tax=Nocardia nova TaxID=37330 RepID=UPI003405E5CB
MRAPQEISGPPVVADARSEDFLAAAERDELVIRRCMACAHFLAPEVRTCTRCGGTELDRHVASGSARLMTWSVVHHSPLPAFADQVPFAVAYVETAEGPWLNARLAGLSLAELRAGLDLTVAFVHPDEGASYPIFVPDNEDKK